MKAGFVRMLLLIGASAVANACFAQTGAPFPGPKTDFRGFDCYRVPCGGDGRPFIVVVPKQAAPGMPWIWCGSFWGDKVIHQHTMKHRHTPRRSSETPSRTDPC